MTPDEQLLVRGGGEGTRAKKVALATTNYCNNDVYIRTPPPPPLITIICCLCVPAATDRLYAAVAARGCVIC